MSNEVDRHLLNQEGLDQADHKTGLDVSSYNFESVHYAAWYIMGLMSCNRNDIEEIGKCRHWMAINGLIEAVKQEYNQALLVAAQDIRKAMTYSGIQGWHLSRVTADEIEAFDNAIENAAS